MRIAKSLLVAATLLLLQASPAAASHWWTNGAGEIVHLNGGHTPTFMLANMMNDPTMWTAVDHARGDWSGASPYITFNNWNGVTAEVSIWAGQYCNGKSGWVDPVTAAGGVGTTNPGGHADGMWAHVSVCWDSWAYNGPYNATRMIACHELGHAIGGMSEGGAAGDPGCMSATYVGGTNPAVAAYRSPHLHDLDHVGHLWFTLH